MISRTDCPGRRDDSVGGDRRRERVGGIDYRVDPVLIEPRGQPVDAAEPPDADLARRQQRVTDPPGERRHHGEGRVGVERRGERPGLGGAAEDQRAKRQGRPLK